MEIRLFKVRAWFQPCRMGFHCRPALYPDIICYTSTRLLYAEISEGIASSKAGHFSMLLAYIPTYTSIMYESWTQICSKRLLAVRPALACSIVRVGWVSSKPRIPFLSNTWAQCWALHITLGAMLLVGSGIRGRSVHVRFRIARSDTSYGTGRHVASRIRTWTVVYYNEVHDEIRCWRTANMYECGTYAEKIQSNLG